MYELLYYRTRTLYRLNGDSGLEGPSGEILEERSFLPCWVSNPESAVVQSVA